MPLGTFHANTSLRRVKQEQHRNVSHTKTCRHVMIKHFSMPAFSNFFSVHYSASTMTTMVVVSILHSFQDLKHFCNIHESKVKRIRGRMRHDDGGKNAAEKCCFIIKTIAVNYSCLPPVSLCQPTLVMQKWFFIFRRVIAWSEQDCQMSGERFTFKYDHVLACLSGASMCSEKFCWNI